MVDQETSVLPRMGKPRFYYGYILTGAAFSIMMIVHGTFNTFGVFFNPLLTEFGWSRAVLSGASSSAFLIMGFIAIIAGGLTDKFGPRIVMAACGFFFGLGHLLMSQVNAIWQLYLFWVVIGVGFSASDVVPLTIIARWFVKKRGIMSGIAKIGTGLGIFIMPLVASGLILAYGWRTSYIILSILVIVSVIPLAQLLRRDPGEKGQLPDGEKQANAESLDLVEGGLSLQKAIHTRQLWMICAAYLLIFFCGQTVMVHIAPHAVNLGISTPQAAGILSAIGGVSMVGRLVLGYAGDRVGNKQAMIICFLILLVALSWLQLTRQLWTLYLFAVVYGFSHGGFFALISPTVAGLFGTRSQGALLGTVIFSGSIGGAIGPILGGHIFDITHSYRLDFLILIALAITGLILITLLKPINN